MKNLLLRSRYWVLAAGLLLASPAIWSCSADTTYTKQLREHQDQLQIIDEDTIHNYLVKNNLLRKATRTSSGLYMVDSVAGTGAPITAGSKVRLKYIGRFLSNGAHPESSGYAASYGNSNFPVGSIFDNSADNNTVCGCAVFTQGGNNVAGFNEGLLLMRQGDRKLLLIPSRLAYGPSGQSNPNTGAIIFPADAAIMFDVEVLDVL
jgi:FKBP-type peptidyl-prolyl cis-trans isomerase